jgi:uncharacterized protein
MRVRILGLAALGLLFVGPAMAASFDCHKARTPFAKAICGHPELSKADETLAETLKTALAGLSPDAAAMVQRGHDDWVKYANLACTKDARLPTRPYKADDIECLKQLFSDRTTTLASSKTIGGLRFYSVDRYATLIDSNTDSSAMSPVATKAVSTPRIDGSDAEAAAFNAFVKDETSKDTDISVVDIKSPDDGSEDDENTLVVSAVTPARITMTATSYAFGHGAAHGNYAITYVHYLRAEQRRLLASDVFAADDWQKKLQTIALPAVTKAEGDDLMLDDPKSLDPLVIDPGRWDFSKAGLVLQFEPYEIAAYAVGAPTVTIPWSDLDGLLAPDAARLED